MNLSGIEGIRFNGRRWKHHVEMSAVIQRHRDDETPDFPAIAAEIRAAFLAAGLGNHEIMQYVEELAGASEEDAFNDILDSIYDQADWNRIWLGGR